MNNKILLTVVCGLIFTPFMVSADDGPMFNCWSPKLTPSEIQELGTDAVYYDVSNKIRGTCKQLDISAVVALDPALQNDYLLGKHSPMDTGKNDISIDPSKYSEVLHISSSPTSVGTVYVDQEYPIEFALFDKSYFVPLLSSLFKQAKLSFLETNFPEVRVYIYNKQEILPETIQRYMGDKKTDSLSSIQKNSNDQTASFEIHTFNYREYGKNINAPKGDLVESQYVDVEKGANLLTNNDLQIKEERAGHWGSQSQAVVPVTSPLKAVKNYWLYTKKDGKLVLAWQKSEYTLDSGKVKTITNADKNVSAALLLSGATDSVATSSTSATTSVQVNTPVAPQVENKKGFFSRFFDFISSWFK